LSDFDILLAYISVRTTYIYIANLCYALFQIKIIIFEKNRCYEVNVEKECMFACLIMRMPIFYGHELTYQKSIS